MIGALYYMKGNTWSVKTLLEINDDFKRTYTLSQRKFHSGLLSKIFLYVSHPFTLNVLIIN